MFALTFKGLRLILTFYRRPQPSLKIAFLLEPPPTMIQSACALRARLFFAGKAGSCCNLEQHLVLCIASSYSCIASCLQQRVS